jgi:hypothetical protein
MGKKQDPSTDEIQREMQAQQKFSVAGAIGRSSGDSSGDTSHNSLKDVTSCKKQKNEG